MAGSLQPRVKTWTTTEDVDASDLNAEFDNVLLAMQPLLMDDYSTNTTQMQVTTDPGEVGTESLATTLAGELARIRFMIKEITGSTTQWYASSSFSLASLGTAAGGGIPDNRIVSGRARSESTQPIFLVPHGAARTVTLKGATTNFLYVIDGVQYTISTDVTITGLSAAASTDNTCLVDDAGIADQEMTKYVGEYGSSIVVDAMGTSITPLVGQLAGFKINNGVDDEYFIARVASTTKLTNVQRGLFFDSADAPIPRIAIADNDTITLMKLTWVFAKTDGTLTVSYVEPRVGKDEPLTPTTNDYWFDTSTGTWKVYGVSSFAAANAILIGVCLQDATNTVAARGFDPFKAVSDLNTLSLEVFDATQVRAKRKGGIAHVYGTKIEYYSDIARWDMDTDLDTGLTEAADTTYYLYITEEGESIISTEAPMDRSEDLFGLYHPHQTWRCFGQVYNNASSNFEAVLSYNDESINNYALSHKVASNALTLKLHVSPKLKLKFKDATLANPGYQYASVLPGTLLLIASGSTLGTTSAVEELLYCGLVLINERTEMTISLAPNDLGQIVTTTAEAGNGDSPGTLYSLVARSNVPFYPVARLHSTQTVAGTWAAAMTRVTMWPYGDFIPRTEVILATKTVVIPPGCYFIKGIAAGGGGGGGSGVAPGHSGGGGGAGAMPEAFATTVVPGESVVFTIGAGGAGGDPAGTGTGVPGVAGSSTTIAVPSSGKTLTFPGGTGGNAASGTTGGAAITTALSSRGSVRIGAGAGRSEGAGAVAGENGSDSVYASGGAGGTTGGGSLGAGGGGGAGYGAGGAGTAGVGDSTESADGGDGGISAGGGGTGGAGTSGAAGEAGTGGDGIVIVTFSATAGLT